MGRGLDEGGADHPSYRFDRFFGASKRCRAALRSAKVYRLRLASRLRSILYLNFGNLREGPQKTLPFCRARAAELCVRTPSNPAHN